MHRLERALIASSNNHKARSAERFFKTGHGEYAEADRFLGISMPELRQWVKGEFPQDLTTIQSLLQSQWHEVRMAALLLLVRTYERGDEALKLRVVDCYVNHLAYVNNWDLVDASAYKLLGPHYMCRDRQPLLTMAASESLWTRRIAILTTFYFIRHNDFTTTVQLIDILSEDKEDLMHKACGWMLREIGKRDARFLKDVLKTRYKIMPRTQLRYAIEKMDKAERTAYLRGEK